MAVSQSLSVTQNSQDVQNNASSVRILWKSKQTGESWNGYTHTAYYYVSINGGPEVKYSVSYTLPKQTNKTIVDTTITVPHREDGIGTVTVRTWMDTRISAGEVEKTAFLELTPIPRATIPELSQSVADMGASVTINLPRASEFFTHDLSYAFNGGDFTDIAQNLQADYAWEIPDLSSLVPDANSGIISIRCVTKNGDAVIGSANVQLTANVPDNVCPTVDEVFVAEATEGLSAQFGAFIQGKSRLSVAITASGAGGSTVVAYNATLNNFSYSSDNFTTELLSGSGILRVQAKDSRGRWSEPIETPIEVQTYTPPSIRRFTVGRVSDSGAYADDGCFVSASFCYEVSSCNDRNTAAMKIEYKRSTDDSAGYKLLYSQSSLTADTTELITDIILSPDYQYDLLLTVTDWFGATNNYLTLLPSAQVIMDFGAEGESISFGQTASRKGVFFGWPVKGNVLGLEEATDCLQSGDDADDYKTPGVYAVPTDDIAKTIKNLPVLVPGILVVGNSLGQSDRCAGTESLHKTQKYHPDGSDTLSYKRLMVCDEDGVWFFGPWVSASSVLAAGVIGSASYSAHSIQWVPPAGWMEKTGADIAFVAPCDSAEADNLVISGNTYSFVDANAKAVPGAFSIGAFVKGTLDVDRHYIFLMNAAASKVTEISEDVPDDTVPTTAAVRQYVASHGADYIVECGTEGIWTWEKWHSGKAICWGKKDKISNISFSTSAEGGYGIYYYNTGSWTFPVGLFTDAPIVSFAFAGEETNAFAWGDKITAAGIGNSYIGRGTNKKGSGTPSVYAVGRWK